MRHEHDPIAALATPHGSGPLAVIRASGDGIVDRVSRLLAESVELRVGHAESVRLVFEPGTSPIEARALRYAQGASYTSEESVELFLPSCEPILNAVLERLREVGVRPAEPGEFTRRAFLSGRIDLTRAEAVAQVIAAEDLESARAARRVLDGHLAGEIERLGDAIHDMIALLEAGLDFSEQEVEPPSADSLLEQIREILGQVNQLLASPVSTPRSGARVRIALWGHANAGKSTLFNALLGRESAITSPEAGTTRDPVGAPWIRDGWPEVELLDLPGARDDAVESERAALEIAREELEDVDLVLYLVDVTRPPESTEAEWRSLPAALRDKAWLVGAKGDAAEAAIEPLPDQRLAVSSVGPEPGLDALVAALDSHLTRGRWDDRAAAYLFTDRQRAKLVDAQGALAGVRAGLVELAAAGERVQPELLSIDLRDAHASLEEITGALSTEETLDKIFSRFCLGK